MEMSSRTLHDFRRHQHTAMLDGLSYQPLRVAWTDAGQGKPVFLLHGIPTWSFLYNEVTGPLSQHHRVIAPDFLGHGFSDNRDCFDRSLVAQVKMVLRLMDHLEIPKASFVGHDTGGGVSAILAIEHAHRVDRLILTNAVAYDSWPVDDMLMLGNPRWSTKRPEEIVAYLAGGLPDGFHNKERLTPEFCAGILAPYSDDAGKISIIRNASALNTSHTTMLTDRLKTITAPTLCLWGIHDPWQTIRDGERLATDIPGAKLVRVDEASHWIPHDAPVRFASEVHMFLGTATDGIGKPHVVQGGVNAT